MSDQEMTGQDSAFRMRRLETQEGFIVDTVANLNANYPAGIITRWAFATDGRKTGEGIGAGTGVMCYDDGVNWVRVDDGTAVAA